MSVHSYILFTQGHIAKDCSNDAQLRHSVEPKQHRFKQVVCDNCGGLNHYAKDCQASDIVCYNCKKHGHIARECPLAVTSVQPNAIHNNRPIKTCYNCDKPGHIARNCLIAKRERDEDTDEADNDTEDATDDDDEVTGSELSGSETESDEDNTA